MNDLINHSQQAPISTIALPLHHSSKPGQRNRVTHFRWRWVGGIGVAIVASLAFWLSMQGMGSRPLLAQDAPQSESQPQSCPLYPSEHQRMGFNFDLGAGQQIASYDYAQLNAGWYHDYSRQLAPPDDISYHQMIRATFDTANLTRTVGPIVDANPGALWYLGNEPDKAELQDSKTPAEYARFYGEAYTFLKQRDPTSRVAIAGIVQATPLRLAYLDEVLAAYALQNNGAVMPIDVMTVHGFILCEDCDWGAGIPPGMAAYESLARHYEVSDHIDMGIFTAQIVAMRQWMAERGYRDRPLIVNEYGVLMPVFFEGFGYEEVRDFMLASFDFFRTAVDEEIGYEADGNRLVQEWAWFSLNAPAYQVDDQGNVEGFNGELFDRETFAIKQWGLDYQNYAASLVQSTDMQISSIQINPTFVVTSTASTATLPKPIDVTVTLKNLGNVTAYGASVSLWAGDPANGGTSIANAQRIEILAGGATTSVQFRWTPASLANGRHELVADVAVDSCNPEAAGDNPNQRKSGYLVVLRADELQQLYLPVID